MNEEIIEEVNIDTSNEIVDDIELVDSVEEGESLDSYSENDIVSALLHLLNEQNEFDQEEIEDEILENEFDPNGEPVPLLIQNVDYVDYTEILTELNERLENVEELLIESNTPKTLDTPLSEYSLDSVLLVFVLIVLGLSLGYQFLKDNFLKF